VFFFAWRGAIGGLPIRIKRRGKIFVTTNAVEHRLSVCHGPIMLSATSVTLLLLELK
jgi:hypothetical protein